MIRLDCVQGSPQWLAARRGRPTASQYHRIVTPRTMRLSAAATDYRNELLAEWLLGESLGEETTRFMDRGHDLEEGALAFYELQRELDVDRPGFLLRDDERTGCSPDGLVGTDGGVEIKCPSAAVHVGYLLDAVGDRYKAQVQGNLWIAEREWWDVLAYHPTLPPALVRCHRDEAFIAGLAVAVAEFCDQLDGARVALQSHGLTAAELDGEPTAVAL